MTNLIEYSEDMMKTLKVTLLVLVLLVLVLPVFAATAPVTDKTHKAVVMIIPDPKAPQNAEALDSPAVNTAYNEITSELLSKNITVIDKSFVEEALDEIRMNQDIDMDAASIQYGKKNMADKVMWFYVVNNSGNYQDFRYETRIKLISVRTGQVTLSLQKEGIDKENKEAAIQLSVKNTLAEALPLITTASEMFTVTFKGKIKLEVQNELDNIFNSIESIDSFDGYVVNTNAYEYRVASNATVSALRNGINERIKKQRIEIELESQTINSLVFRMIPKRTIHTSLRTISGLSSLVAAGATGYFYMMSDNNYTKYQDARTPNDLQKYKDAVTDNDNNMMLAGIGTGVLTTWFIYEVVKVNQLKKVEAISLYIPDKKTVGLFVSARF
jgi:hypothetical protein